MKKTLFSLILVLAFGLLITKPVQASEGIFELSNKNGESGICHITSGIMQNQQFSILTLCRDIRYPGGTEVFQYVAWATPIDGGKAIRLGTLGLGKQLFKAKKPFNSIFVTKELNGKARSPGGTLVMSGNLQLIEFLENRHTNTVSEPSGTQNELIEEATPSPTSNIKKNNTNIFRLLAAGGVLAFLAIFGIILVVFVVNRR